VWVAGQEREVRTPSPLQHDWANVMQTLFE